MKPYKKWDILHINRWYPDINRILDTPPKINMEPENNEYTPGKGKSSSKLGDILNPKGR